MLSFKIKSTELEDLLLVPFYKVLRITNKSKITIDSVAAEITNGIDLRTYKDEGPLYLRGSDIKRCQIDLLTAKHVDFPISKIPYKIKLEPGDILITRKGTVGIASIFEFEPKDLIIGTEIIKIRLKEDCGISPEYFYTFLNSKLGILQVISRLTGTVARGINHNSLKEIKIFIPSEEEMERINTWVKEAKMKHGRAITLIDDAKRKLMSVLEIPNLKNVMHFMVPSKSLDTDFFTPRFYSPVYTKTLKSLKERFNTIKLGKVANIQKGNEVGSDNYRDYIDKLDTDVPFVRTSDLPNYEIDDYPDYYIGREIFEELKQDLLPSDIVFSNDGKIGYSAMFTTADKCILQSHIRRVRVLETFRPEYVLVFLNTIYGEHQVTRRTVIQSTIPTIGDGLKEIEIPKISTDSETEISDMVKEAYKLIAEKKVLIRKAKALIEEII